ncbi:hypothetical protein [Lewinella cohaerens]|uniref:hypothetical protein n=1 Tax=Lewinella cohaerens TaxID=70995 RepID=UPI0003637A20|nr:hypothetical protein [Lewinella cohaerens]
MIDQLINWGNSDPRKLFLVDGLGAMLSAFLLGVVLVEFEEYFGIPRPTLYTLALLPCLFASYDFFCYQKKNRNIAPLLKGIALLNISYCLLSIGLAIYHYERITYLAWGYILIEVLIVMTLAMIELKVSDS